MGILDNLESAWDEEFHFETNPIVETNSLGEKNKYPDIKWYNLSMSENEVNPMEIDPIRCCGECTCTQAHRSTPVPTE